MIRARILATAMLLATGLGPAIAAPPPALPGPPLTRKLPPGLPGDFFKLRPPAFGDCTRLTRLVFPNGRVVSALIIDGGTFDPPGDAPLEEGLPKFCRVTGTASTERGSLINFEVWIPFDGSYRSRYLQVGNGGFSGVVPYGALAEGIRRGYAAAGTDDGNPTPGSAAFAREAPKLRDYGYRAIKETTDKAKSIIQEAMGAGPRRSYFHGCSNGGRQALMEVQRYPGDFDGVLAGAPANFFTHQFISFAWNTRANYQPAPSLAKKILASHLPILSNEVRRQCAGTDGGLASDKFLTNPLACRVNFAPITCGAGGPPGTCLSEEQIETVKAIYDGPRYTAARGQIYPGLAPGAEDYPWNWPVWVTGVPAPAFGFQTQFGGGFFAHFVHGVDLYDLRNVTYGAADVAGVDDRFASILNSTEPNLSAFYDRGGKLIQYHGFDDAAVAPRNSIDYWASVEQRMREVRRRFGRADLDGFYRLFMVPGMAHCWAGLGATAFGNAERGSAMDATHDAMLALERWVERGIAPERIIAKSSVFVPGPAFERPLCPYPKLPRYNGRGDARNAANWSCAVPSLFPKRPADLIEPRPPFRVPIQPDPSPIRPPVQ
jgi:Tannase and feruloyl esterase